MLRTPVRSRSRHRSRNRPRMRTPRGARAPQGARRASSGPSPWRRCPCHRGSAVPSTRAPPGRRARRAPCGRTVPHQPVSPGRSAWPLACRAHTRRRFRPCLHSRRPGGRPARSIESGGCPVPPIHRFEYSFERDKFAAAGLTPTASDVVRPPRVAECALLMEAGAIALTPGGEERLFRVETEALTPGPASPFPRPHTDPEPFGYHCVLFTPRKAVGGEQAHPLAHGLTLRGEATTLRRFPSTPSWHRPHGLVTTPPIHQRGPPL